MAELLKTSNPALNENTFQGPVAAAGEAMTLQGTVNKTGVLLLCVVATGRGVSRTRTRRKPRCRG